MGFSDGQVEAGVDTIDRAFSHPSFATFKGRGAPLLIITAGAAPGVFWANRAALTAFDARDVPHLRRRIAKGAVESLLGTRSDANAPAPPHLGRLRLHGGSGASAVTVWCQRVPGASEAGLLAVAVLDAGANLLKAALRSDISNSAAVDPAAGSGAPGFSAAAGVDDEGAPGRSPGGGSAHLASVRDALRRRFGYADTVRFVWHTDAAGILAEHDPRPFDRPGTLLRPRDGQHLLETIAAFDREGAEAIGAALAKPETWSGIETRWPLAEGVGAVPVVMNAAPVFERGGQFGGFRGFGVINLRKVIKARTREAPQSEATTAEREADLHHPEALAGEAIEPSQVHGGTEAANDHSPIAPGTSLSPRDDFARLAALNFPVGGTETRHARAGGQPGGGPLKPVEEPTAAGALAQLVRPADDMVAPSPAANVLRFRPFAPNLDVRIGGPGPGSPRPSADADGTAGEVASDNEDTDAPVDHGGDPSSTALSSGEHLAFQEIARALGARLDRIAPIYGSEHPPQSAGRDGGPPDPDAPGTEPDEPGRQGEGAGLAPVALLNMPAFDGELKGLLDSAGEAIAALDATGSIQLVNRLGQAWFGIGGQWQAGESFLLTLAPESRAAAALLFSEVVASGRDGPGAAVSQEVFGRTSDPAPVPMLLTLCRTGARSFAARWRDMSGQRRLERELARLQREAERAKGKQAELLAKISHEIRTPLNGILGFAEVMMDERLGSLGNPRYRDYLKDIHASGTHVMSMVTDLLDLSRIEAGRLDVDLGAVDLNRMVNECVSHAQSDAHRERVIMRTSLSPRLPAIVADERSVRQIIANLLTNAIRFNEPGGQVIVSTAAGEANAVALRIRDTGVGMSETEIAAAIEPFGQLGPARARGGGGLGLPLARALINANQATLAIRSRPKEGTLVEVSFTPAATMAPPAEARA